MEEEFQKIAGVSAPLWGFVVAFMLFNVKGSNLYFWIALIPVAWQFGYNSCFIKNHFLVYLRLILGFTGQFLCSYSTLPLYALVTQTMLTVTDTSTVISLEEYDSDQLPDTPRFTNASAEIELQTHNIFMNDNDHSVRVANENSSRVGTPLLQHSASISSPVSLRILPEVAQRSSSMPR
ncbi:mlo-like protein 11 [Phtheirospermum japonicum]|uniref:Mlo-like protein 11 n=1 Tax=Phtheirospermum japonicum TaxID=374723 RepID=A0A830D7F1_9LAMI|nr:mlo-like protein 11 [Phtheirospermum japonicum]